MKLNHPVFLKTDKQSLGYLSKSWLIKQRTSGLKIQTLDTRLKWIKLFLIWCEERGLSQAPEITRPVLEQYQAYLASAPLAKEGLKLKPLSQLNRINGVRIFFKWLSKNRVLMYNPAADLELPRQPRLKLRDILTVAEVESVLAAPNLKRAYGIRDRAIMETFYSTGIRKTELSFLKLEEVDFESGTLKVSEGKGGKQRLVPIGNRAMAWINKYSKEVRSKHASPAEYLFLTRSGSQIKNPTEIVWKHMTKAGIKKEGACHLFRHSMATLMLKNGADIRVVQEILGHSQIKTTQRYTHLCIDHLKLIHSKTHPARYPGKDEEQRAE